MWCDESSNRVFSMDLVLLLSCHSFPLTFSLFLSNDSCCIFSCFRCLYVIFRRILLVDLFSVTQSVWKLISRQGNKNRWNKEEPKHTFVLHAMPKGWKDYHRVEYYTKWWYNIHFIFTHTADAFREWNKWEGERNTLKLAICINNICYSFTNRMLYFNFTLPSGTFWWHFILPSSFRISLWICVCVFFFARNRKKIALAI